MESVITPKARKTTNAGASGAENRTAILHDRISEVRSLVDRVDERRERFREYMRQQRKADQKTISKGAISDATREAVKKEIMRP